MIINWRIKCRTEYVNTSKHHNSNGMGHQQRISCGHTQWHSFKHPGGTALTTGLLHMSIKWNVTLPLNSFARKRFLLIYNIGSVGQIMTSKSIKREDFGKNVSMEWAKVFRKVISQDWVHVGSAEIRLLIFLQI